MSAKYGADDHLPGGNGAGGNGALWSCLRIATEAVFRHALSTDLGPLSVSYTIPIPISIP